MVTIEEILNNNNETLKTQLTNENNRVKAIQAIIKYDLLKVAVNRSDYELIKEVLEYYPFHYKYSDYESIFSNVFKKSEHENTDGEVDDIVKLLIKTFIQESIKKRKEITENDDSLKLNEDVCFRNLILNIAIRSKNLLVVKYLIKSEDYCASIEDINTKDVYNEYPVVTALNDGNFKIFKYLLDHGADCNTTNNNGFSLFMISVFINKTEEFEYLIHNFSDKINEDERNVARATSKALENKNSTMEKMITDYCLIKNIKFNVYYNDSNYFMKKISDLVNIIKSNIFMIKFNLLMICFKLKTIFCVSLKNFILTRMNEMNLSWFIQCVRSNNINSIILLLNDGFNREKLNSFGDSLFISYKNKHLNLFKYLLGIFDINIRDRYGNTLLMEAIKKNDSEIVKLLINNGANVNINDSNGISAFNLAALRNRREILNELLKNDCVLVNQLDLNGNTPLISLLKPKRSQYLVDIIEKLIKRGADINLKDHSGNTALTYAIQNKNLEVIKLLVTNGGDMNLKNNWFKSPLNYSVSFYNYDCQKYLHEKGYRILDRWNITSYLLHDIIYRRDTNFLKSIINDYNLNLNKKKFLINQKPLLFYAIDDRSLEILDILIAGGANPYNKFKNWHRYVNAFEYVDRKNLNYSERNNFFNILNKYIA